MSEETQKDTQEKISPILNDIYYEEEKKEDIDISSIFLLSEA